MPDPYRHETALRTADVARTRDTRRAHNASCSWYIGFVTSDVAHASLVVHGGGSVRAVLSGEFDILVVQDLDAVLCEAAAGLEPGSRLTVDLTGVTFLDAGCSAVLARTHFRLRDRNIEMQ